MRTNVVPENGMVITESVRFSAGVFVLPDGLTVAADGVTVEGKNTLILSGVKTGAGITAQGCKNVTIRGLSVSGYYHGIRADACRDLVIENVTVRDTAEVDGITTFVYLWQKVEKAYGGAILLNDVQGGAVCGCDLQHQMNGLMLYRCSNLTVENNNASFNSGWGIYLHDSSDNAVQDNRLDFCNRVYRRPEDGSIRVEADAAAIVLVINSSRNKVRRNSCLCGGDGIFVAGYYHPGGVTPCNDNLFEDNDCRLSPNNAIESTFSKGNIFRRNNCSRSNYGFWMGYSWDNVLEDNIVEFNRFVGIAAEHAYDFKIRNNSIRLNGEGIRLWTRGGAVLPFWPGHEVPYDFDVQDNLFETNGIGFRGYTGNEAEEAFAHDFRLRGNTFRDNRIGVQFQRASDCTLEGNTFNANVEAAVSLIGQPGVKIGDNHFRSNAKDVAEV